MCSLLLQPLASQIEQAATAAAAAPAAAAEASGSVHREQLLTSLAVMAAVLEATAAAAAAHGWHSCPTLQLEPQLAAALVALDGRQQGQQVAGSSAACAFWPDQQLQASCLRLWAALLSFPCHVAHLAPQHMAAAAQQLAGAALCDDEPQQLTWHLGGQRLPGLEPAAATVQGEAEAGLQRLADLAGQADGGGADAGTPETGPTAAAAAATAAAAAAAMRDHVFGAVAARLCQPQQGAAARAAALVAALASRAPPAAWLALQCLQPEAVRQLSAGLPTPEQQVSGEQNGCGREC